MVRLRGAGPNIYSQPVTQRTRSLREHLGVPKNRRLLVAYTSSVDEEICTKKALDVFSVAPPSFEQPYSDQITWLQEIAAFVEKRDDLYLIVRIHPREGRNHIDNIESDHLHALRHSFSQRDLQNTTFIWPENKISSYDLGEEANLVLISWSNIGLELSRLAVPVLASMIRISTVPHDDFIVRVPDKERYYQKIDELLVRPPNLATVQHAFRWYGVTKFATSIDISDVLPTPLGDEIRDFVLPRNHELIEKVILGGCAIHELQLERHQMASKPDDLEQESAEIALQFRRILHFLMTGNDIDGDKPLSLVWGDAAQLRPSIGCETENCIFTDGVNCTYISDRKTFNKYSPLVSRMAQIGGTPVSAPPPGTRQANDAVGEKVHA